MKNDSLKRGVVRLCHTEDCCPALTKEGSKYVLTDDFGGKVVLTRKQAIILIAELCRMFTEKQTKILIRELVLMLYINKEFLPSNKTEKSPRQK